jgi:hypothetical protein
MQVDNFGFVANFTYFKNLHIFKRYNIEICYFCLLIALLCMWDLWLWIDIVCWKFCFVGEVCHVLPVIVCWLRCSIGEICHVLFVDSVVWQKADLTRHLSDRLFRFCQLFETFALDKLHIYQPELISTLHRNMWTSPAIIILVLLNLRKGIWPYICMYMYSNHFATICWCYSFIWNI